MHNLLHRIINPMSGLQRLTDAIMYNRWRFRERWRRITRAWRYARQRLTTDDAQVMMLDCRAPSGWYPLIVLTVDDALQQAYTEFDDHPELPRLIAAGCARVSTKWEDFSYTLDEAPRWAIELAKTYAAQEDIVLTPRRDDTSHEVEGSCDGG